MASVVLPVLLGLVMLGVAITGAVVVVRGQRRRGPRPRRIALADDLDEIIANLDRRAATDELDDRIDDAILAEIDCGPADRPEERATRLAKGSVPPPLASAAHRVDFMGDTPALVDAAFHFGPRSRSRAD